MKNINSILEKYFEGKTSLKEEELLRKYFRQDDIPENLKQYKPLFNFFFEERENKKAENKRYGNKSRKQIVFFKICAGIAAGLLLLFSIRPLFPDQIIPTSSTVYIDGIRYTELDIVNSEALNALENISGINGDLINSQIDILNSFNDF